MAKNLVQKTKQGSWTVLILLWIFFFWIPIIPLGYWLFKMKKTKTYAYE